MVAAAAAEARASEEDVIVFLRHWMEDEFFSSNNPQGQGRRIKESIIRKTTVAYGIVELLARWRRCYTDKKLTLLPLQNNEEKIIRLDNFAVCISRVKQGHKSSSAPPSSLDDIKGVSMLSSGLSLSIEEPAYLSFLDDDEGGRDDKQLGKYLEVKFTSNGGRNKDEITAANGDLIEVEAASEGGNDRNGTARSEEEEKSHQLCCYLITKVLYELFTGEVFPENNKYEGENGRSYKRVKMDLGDLNSMERMQSSFGVPVSICRMMQNLLDSALTPAPNDVVDSPSDDAYKTLKEVGEDLHLLLFDPDRFLFDRDADVTDRIPLLFKKDKLYGRDKEEDLITDTFCRVTRGQSEALFIGGFSGSGKSMLVNTLRERVKVVGGYVIKHKFDAISQDRPISGVVSAVDQLCVMILARHTPNHLVRLVQKIKDEFGADIGLLARMLPSISLLSPHFIPSISLLSPQVEQVVDTMNAHSVCFTLLRFIRIVSSPNHPIMLFLDDLQWADDTALDIIRAFLSDKMGSCMFFVGTYRNNEVDIDHALFDFMEKLEISNVPTTKLSLTGLGLEDLNTMISDALCLSPRICMSLSKIVFQKTKGNPFFVLEFMQSLQSRGLLYWDCRRKRWVWNEVSIDAEDITDNVLHLLSSKMNGLSNDMQLLLKAMACFGTSIDESVIKYLSEVPEYVGVGEGLEKAVTEGYVERCKEGNIKFVHDKVREAAYDLIPDEAKNQVHYDLGKALLSVCDGRDVGDTILVIASQINHGKESIQKNDELCISMAGLNMAAGKKAIESCRHKMAYSYLENALSLLPDDHWNSNYDLSRHITFMMASAANSSSMCDEAENLLQMILEKGRCMTDKLPSYHLLVTIFLSQGKVVDAFNTCSLVLSHLGETIPENVTPQAVEAIVPETLHKIEKGYNEEWLGKKIENASIRQILKFYTALITASYFFKAPHVMAYFVCRMIQLSLEHGVSKYTPLAFLQLSNIVMSFDNAAFIYPIAKSAMSLSERFNLPDQVAELRLNFYMGAGSLEPFHSCAAGLRGGFQSGLSSGTANMAFYCAVLAAHFSFISGEKDLSSLMAEIDYYLHLLETYKSEMAKNFLLCIRESVSILIDNGEATSIEAKASYGDLNDPGNMLLETYNFHQMLRCFWKGHIERAQYYVEKYDAMIRPTRNCDKIIMKFYHGVNALDILKKKMSASKRDKVRGIIQEMKVAAYHSEANHRHMLLLLEAEWNSIQKDSDVATVAPLYDAAIATARNSKYIHAQGLACEKAGFYHKGKNDAQSAVNYFKQARECYEMWGSNLKVASTQRELDSLALEG